MVGHEPTFLRVGELCYSVACRNLLGCLNTDGLSISTVDGFPRFGRHFSIRVMHQRLLGFCSEMFDRVEKDLISDGNAARMVAIASECLHRSDRLPWLRIGKGTSQAADTLCRTASSSNQIP